MIELRNQIFRCRRHVELFCIMCSMEASSSKVKQDKTNKPTNKKPPKQTKQNKLKLNKMDLVGELESAQIIQ